MALLILRETSAMGPLLALHLGVVFALSSPCPTENSCMASIGFLGAGALCEGAGDDGHV